MSESKSPPRFIATLVAWREAQEEATRALAALEKKTQSRLRALLSEFNFRDVSVSLSEYGYVNIDITGAMIGGASRHTGIHPTTAPKNYHTLRVSMHPAQAETPQMIAVTIAMQMLLPRAFIENIVCDQGFARTKLQEMGPQKISIAELEKKFISMIETIPAKHWPTLTREQRADLLKRSDLTARIRSAVMIAPWHAGTVLNRPDMVPQSVVRKRQTR